MRIKMFFVILIGVLACTQTVFAAGTRGFQVEQKTSTISQPSAVTVFAEELSSLRKKIIAACAQFQAGRPRESREQLLAEIDAIIAGWQAITAAYQGVPPSEYAHDPSWQGYFAEALDNFELMRAKAEQGNYKRATQFCGMNCGLFVTMNQVNGIDRFSDRMFLLRKQAKTATDMALANNRNGAMMALKQADGLLVNLLAAGHPPGMDPEAFQADLKRLEKAYQAFAASLRTEGKDAIVPAFKEFLKIFGEIYLRVI